MPVSNDEITLPVSILDIAIAHGAKAEPDGAYTWGEFARLGLPFMAGCEVCGAVLAVYNAYPSTSGYTRCADDIGNEGYATVADFDGDD